MKIQQDIVITGALQTDVLDVSVVYTRTTPHHVTSVSKSKEGKHAYLIEYNKVNITTALHVALSYYNYIHNNNTLELLYCGQHGTKKSTLN